MPKILVPFIRQVEFGRDWAAVLILYIIFISMHVVEHTVAEGRAEVAFHRVSNTISNITAMYNGGRDMHVIIGMDDNTS